MRYYDILITNPKGGAVIKHYTSFVSGQTDPGALNVELDILIAPQATPFGNSYVRVWGISLQDIGQAADLNFMLCQVSGGMQKGLPLANPRQAGILVKGMIIQAFGNWQGNNMTMDLLLTAAPPTNNQPTTQATPANISFNWPVGTPMADAIQSALQTAAPGYTVKVSISPKLVFAETCAGFYQTFAQFADMVKMLSQSIVGGTYIGVDISINQNTITVSDNTVQPAAKQLAFNDLIGQVTWIGPQQLSAKCVMRADIAVGDVVKLPPGQIATTAQSLSQFRQGSVFQGAFLVTEVRACGNFRQPDGNSWATILTLAGPTAAAA